VEARRLLAKRPIVLLTRDGKLSPTGEQALRDGFDALPWLFARAGLDARLSALPFSTRRQRLELRVRYSTDYRIKLGRVVGKARLGPHPKRISVEIKLAGKTTNFECRTPKFKRADLGSQGLSEETVWAHTIALFANRLGALLARTGP